MSSDDEDELRKALDAELLQVTERVGKNKKKNKEAEPKEKKKKKKSSSKKRKKKRNDSDDDDEVSESDEDDFLEEEYYTAPPKKKSTPKEPSTSSAAVPLKKRAKAADDDAPREDGEIASKGTPAPAAADEESSEIEPFDDGYDEDLMGDEKDRERLANLNERDREQVLADRYERRRELKEKWEERRRLHDEKHNRKGKRVPSTPRGDALSARKKGTASAFAELRARRAANKGVSTPRQRRSEEDEEGDDYVDEEESRPASSSRRESAKETAAPQEKSEEEQDATPEQVQTVCLRRDQLAKWHNQPFFEKFAPGFLVRIGIGKTRTGEAVYRVAEIVEVKDGREHREYKFGGRPTRRGVAIRSFPMEVVSNSPFSPSELARFASSTRSAGMPLLTVGAVKQKQQELKIMENYTYTDEEVAKIVLQKERERANRRPLNAALERKQVADQIRILKQHMHDPVKSNGNRNAEGGDGLEQPDAQLEVATTADDLDEKEANNKKLEELQTRLGELDMWLQQEEEELRERRAVDLDKINKRNMEINEKQLAERRRAEAEKQKNTSVRSEKLDPFSRRPTQPTGMYISQRMLEDEKKAKEEAAAKKKAEAERALRASLEAVDAADAHADALGRELAEVVSKGHGIRRSDSNTGPAAKPVALPKPLQSPDASAAPKPPPGKTLSLNDYFKRRANVHK